LFFALGGMEAAVSTALAGVFAENSNLKNQQGNQQ
jgi:hypothetical protein